ncbi:DUF2165 family protein [Saccharospirillum salsuginis]|uniref:DUF2165 domain-containing protein n=1 Tax=Saccharospirillum salsuginis TaxID=418750 RepID=A0A918KPX1_9GAMM|nr:DUF2165 family protein [Saccharospirillum salsuginis]GGX71349.1 hypothetical protein GCM10007392_43550 [Saccharospirillum salsuginis]
MRSNVLFKAVIITGLATWLTIAATNNALDRGTNVHLLSAMFSMSGLIDDPVFGNGLENRAIQWEGAGALALTLIVIVQYAIAIGLWVAAVLQWRSAVRSQGEQVAITATNLALAAFASLWLFFLCGGLYFGYWLKFSGPQSVHFTLLILSVITMMMNNQPVRLAQDTA